MSDKINTTVLLAQAEEADAAGFTAAAVELRKKAELARKLAIAYEHFRFVKQEAIDAFSKKLHEKTYRPATAEDAARMANRSLTGHATYLEDKLTLVAMETYPGLPPGDVLGKVKDAKALKCFDRFEVAEVNPVSTRVKLPDPIVFGIVDGCSDKFYVAEWGSDVSIKDLIGKNEG